MWDPRREQSPRSAHSINSVHKQPRVSAAVRSPSMIGTSSSTAAAEIGTQHWNAHATTRVIVMGTPDCCTMPVSASTPFSALVSAQTLGVAHPCAMATAPCVIVASIRIAPVVDP